MVIPEVKALRALAEQLPIFNLVRCRPLLPAEITAGSRSCVTVSGQEITVADTGATEGGTRDEKTQTRVEAALPETATQENVFDAVAPLLIDKLVHGINACVFAFGQTGSGKSHTMLGTNEDPGLISRVCAALFPRLTAPFMVTASFCEISPSEVGAPPRSPAHAHGPAAPVARPIPRFDGPLPTLPRRPLRDSTSMFMPARPCSRRSTTTHHPGAWQQIRDLLNPVANQSLPVFYHSLFGYVVEGLSWLVCHTVDDALAFLRQGDFVRRAGDPTGPARSSCIFTLRIQQRAPDESLLSAELKFAVMADKIPGVWGFQQVMARLLKVKHLTEKDGKLVKLLRQAIFGNAFTVALVTIAPPRALTSSTLRYTMVFKKIVNACAPNREQSASIIDQLRQVVTALQAAAEATPPDPSAAERLQVAMKELDMAKREAWDEKERLSERLAAERKENLKREGLIDALATTRRPVNPAVTARRDQLAAELAPIDQQLLDMKRALKEIKADVEAQRAHIKTLPPDAPDRGAAEGALKEREAKFAELMAAAKPLNARHKQLAAESAPPLVLALGCPSSWLLAAPRLGSWLPLVLALGCPSSWLLAAPRLGCPIDALPGLLTRPHPT
ncbi:putative Kinesin motor domain [Paratrimastix pyriformis]|uniref:Kinesin motor domain n=1 Tax=Paratrimastix pyriformis TaxID=342808 RepID=A0ABQ8UN92_9EUKA|nr:putative Kinesin motor domain [Paratrimastix pyriformis]